MFGAIFKFFSETQNVHRAVDKAAYKSFGHAAASIRKEAIASIQKNPEGKSRDSSTGRYKRVSASGSPPGTPPYTHKGAIKRAIVYKADKRGAVIGPRFSRLGTAGTAHEFGGKYKGQTFPKRPFMAPALKKNLNRIGGSFRGSIGQ